MRDSGKKLLEPKTTVVYSFNKNRTTTTNNKPERYTTSHVESKNLSVLHSPSVTLRDPRINKTPHFFKTFSTFQLEYKFTYSNRRSRTEQWYSSWSLGGKFSSFVLYFIYNYIFSTPTPFKLKPKEGIFICFLNVPFRFKEDFVCCIWV